MRSEGERLRAREGGKRMSGRRKGRGGGDLDIPK